MLEKLITKANTFHNGQVFCCLFLTAFLGFFRSSTLVPTGISQFDKTRFPISNDVMFVKPIVHLIITCSKTMQKLDQVQVVYLPNLTTKNICPVKALK